MNLKEFRDQFPGLNREVYNKPLVYLDNAATSQRPVSVLDLAREAASDHNANVHRAVYATAAEATDLYEGAREAVRAYINAESTKEIIFTSGTTAAINLVAFSFGEAFVKKDDEIILSVAEHHSNLIPWQLLAQRKGAKLRYLDIDDSGRLKIENLAGMINDRTRLVAVSHVSNILGVLNPIKEIVDIAHSAGVPVLVDGAQGIIHYRPDVQDLGCDFYAFSGHKIFAATGTGVLYGKRDFLEAMPPYMGGGEMIDKVTLDGSTFAELPVKFEAGTPNFNSAPTFLPAIELLLQCADTKEIKSEQEAIRSYMFQYFASHPEITLYGNPDDEAKKTNLYSFSVKGVHHEDLALILDKMGFALRSGHICAQPLMQRFGISGVLRASFGLYNTLEEAKNFTKALDRAITMLI